MAKAIIISHQENWLAEVANQIPTGLENGKWDLEVQSAFDLFIHADIAPVSFGEKTGNPNSLHIVNCFFSGLQAWKTLNPDWNIVAGVKLHPAFFAGNIWEIICGEYAKKAEMASIFESAGISLMFVADGPCTTAARLVTMIINEAFLTLDEQVAAASDIDLAMKLGTGYPFGPFEWAKKIGLTEVVKMLLALQKFHNSDRYQPSKLLLKQAHD